MIPEKIARFLEERATAALAATRDAALVPAGHRVSAWIVSPDRRMMTIFVPDPFATRMVDSLTSNGHIAVTLEEFPTHETYQFKGRYRVHRPVEPGEHEHVNRTRERFVKNVSMLYPGEEAANLLRATVGRPAIAVEFEVNEVFLQTPGPGAGGRIYPPAEA